MSSFDRRTLLLLCAGLAGCGFTPALTRDGSSDGLRGRIAYDPPSDREGFFLIRALERRLGRPSVPQFQLSATVFVEEEEAGITPEQVITRFRLIGTAEYALRDVLSDQIVASGDVSNFAGYSATANTVAVRTAAEDARQRLMTILADQISNELLATSPDWLT